MYYATFMFYIQLLIETFLQIMNDQLYLNLSFIYNIHIFCISVFFHIISYIIYIDLIFIFSMACIMTFSILHVYLQRKTTLGVHTCSRILMIFDTVFMFYFYILMIMSVFECILTCTVSCTFNKFWYFISTNQTNVIKFPNCFLFISFMLQLSYVDISIDRKNQMYSKYYSYHNVSSLYSKIPRIYIILGNLKSEYNIIIIYSLTAIYLEVQLCTTCKAVKYRNNIINIIHNLLCFLYLWIASLLIIVTSLKKVIINFNELSLNCYTLCILIYVNIKKLNL